MGSACTCLQTPNDSNLKTNEIENLVSSETYPDWEMAKALTLVLNPPRLLRRLLKTRLVSKYLEALKNPLLFKVPHPFCSRSLRSFEIELIRSIEEEYGEFRITPVWGDYIVTLPLIRIKDSLYEGDWDFFTKTPHGSGVLYNQKTCEKYSGNFKFGKRHGLGRVIQPNGDLYEGEFVEDEIQGFGTLIDHQGKVYIGSFNKGMKEGQGKEQDRHESCYEGEFEANMRHGEGRLIWGDGRCYVGEFFKDKMHGKGECVWPNEKRYYGDWRNGKMNGEGECVWEDGSEYVGGFVEGLQEGRGKLLLADGTFYDGFWKRGEFRPDIIS